MGTPTTDFVKGLMMMMMMVVIETYLDNILLTIYTNDHESVKIVAIVY